MDKRLGVVGLVVLVLADAFLVAWAFGLVPLGGDDAQDSSGATSTAPSTSPSGSTSSSSPTKEKPTAVPLVEALDADRALRASYTPCEGEGGEASTEVERTTDGGKTWESSEVPARTVLRLRLTTESEGFSVVADESCKPRVVTTGDGGATWSGLEAAQSTWGLWPEGGGKILVPGGVSVEACNRADVRSLSAIDARRAYVLCSDGAVRETADGGQTWSGVAKVKGAVALAAREDQAAVLRTTDDCEGVGVRAGTLGEQLEIGEETTCVEGVSSPAAVSVTGDVGWVTDGKATAVGPQLDALDVVSEG